ncbi:MAG: hypothetical protein ISS16_04085 [Ignavibacteria bacterium]|nr:hypothetical protein [Ignavibacteria bacterium]
MIPVFKKKIYSKILFSYLFILLFSPALLSQIKVYERQTTDEILNAGLSYKSDTRNIIDLNGKWMLSFDEGKYFSEYIIPIAYDYRGWVIFKKSFSIPDEMLRNYNFVLFAEGINYEAKIKINNTFITEHEGGFSSIKIPIDENILRDNNEIIIDVSSELDHRNTIPLSNQINFSKNYGGINKDIYILAVPKIYVFENKLDYTIDNKFSVTVTNNCTINSGNIESLLNNENKDFSLKTILVNKATGETVLESNAVTFSIDNFNTKQIANKFVLKNPLYWSPENPQLYIVKTIVSQNENIVDESISEFGICDVKFDKDHITVNGFPSMLKGIDYFEYTPRYASALNYGDTERDLLNIKELGFNCVRVPGRSAHPYIINICNRIGLFLLQEIPFNEVPERILKDTEYTQKAYDYLESIINRDKNSVSIIAWGIGNNFDVTGDEGVNYVKSTKLIVGEIDQRPIYYTTRNINHDICFEYVDLKGINFYTNSSEKIKTEINELKNSIKLNKSGKQLLFISSYGINITNEISNGFSNIHSIEAQTKFLVDNYKILSKSFFGNFVSSYSDWVTERPVNYPQNANRFLKTDGIYDIYGVPKKSAGFLKRVLNDQEISKISEGTHGANDSYIFVVSGIIVLVIFIIISSNVKKFKDNLWKCIIRPNYFFQYAQEQMLISVYQNIILSIFISFGLALYLSALFYFYRDNNFFDMFLANTFHSDYIKIIVSDYINEPYKSIILLSIIFFVIQLLSSSVLYFISLFRRGASYFKNIYTISVWTSLPLLVCLPMGTVIFKLASMNTDYITFSFIIFALAYSLHILRLLSGSRILFELTRFKAYAYGTLIIVFLYGGIFSYFYFFRSTISILDLILSYY